MEETAAEAGICRLVRAQETAARLAVARTAVRRVRAVNEELRACPRRVAVVDRVEEEAVCLEAVVVEDAGKQL